MKIETLLSKINADFLINADDIALKEIITLTIEHIFKNYANVKKEYWKSENQKKKYFIFRQKKGQITSALVLFKKTNPIFKHIIEVLEKEDDEDLINILMDVLVDASKSTYVHTYLVKILKSENLKLKLPIFYHPTISPPNRIIQSIEFRESIVNFINSKEFPAEFKRRKRFQGPHSSLFAFPSQYHICFEIREFDSDLVPNLSKNKMSKLTREMRIESIRLIKDENIQLELLWGYYSSYLPITYSKKFVEIIDRELPHLEKLRRNGGIGYFNC